MAKQEISVTFNTITPLWTGDAWQENSEIRLSSLMGSLRFWFEVICYFSGICNESDFNSNLGRFEKEVNRKDFKNCLLEKGNDFQAKIEYLNKQNIPLPSIIFGTTNWKSLIELKEIKYLNDCCFGNKLSLPNKICINKRTHEIKENRGCPNKSNRDWSVFFFPNPYFYGKFEIIFKVEKAILESIFYPLLTFMDMYGYWGGKWNMGYGRLKVLKVEENNKPIKNWKNEKFLFSKINKKYGDKSFKCFIKDNIFKFNFLTQKENKIQLFITCNSNNSFSEIIKELIKTKARERARFRTNIEDEERHKIFGKTGNPKFISYVPQGSKILPFIYEDENQLKGGGFLSIAGLLNLENISQGEKNE